MSLSFCYKKNRRGRQSHLSHLQSQTVSLNTSIIQHTWNFKHVSSSVHEHFRPQLVSWTACSRISSTLMGITNYKQHYYFWRIRNRAYPRLSTSLSASNTSRSAERIFNNLIRERFADSGRHAQVLPASRVTREYILDGKCLERNPFLCLIYIFGVLQFQYNYTKWIFYIALKKIREPLDRVNLPELFCFAHIF